jgi:hypothetical protein
MYVCMSEFVLVWVRACACGCVCVCACVYALALALLNVCTDIKVCLRCVVNPRYRVLLLIIWFVVSLSHNRTQFVSHAFLGAAKI